MSAFHREHAYVAQPMDLANIPTHKLAENQKPTKENQDLYAAATTGDLEGVTSALSAGGNPNWFKNPEAGASALHKAASGGHVACIELLLKNGSVVDERLLTNQSSPLHLACANGHLEAVKVLVAASAAINAGNSYGNAPIYGALIGGHRAVVETLLDNGSDAKWTNNKHSSLLHFLAYSPMNDTDKEAVMRKLVDSGVDVNLQDEDGMSPLHIVARGGDKAMAKLLLDNGADDTLRDATGKTALQLAQLNSRTEVGLLLNARVAK